MGTLVTGVFHDRLPTTIGQCLVHNMTSALVNNTLLTSSIVSSDSHSGSTAAAVSAVMIQTHRLAQLNYWAIVNMHIDFYASFEKYKSKMNPWAYTKLSTLQHFYNTNTIMHQASRLDVLYTFKVVLNFRLLITSINDLKISLQDSSAVSGRMPGEAVSWKRTFL